MAAVTGQPSELPASVYAEFSSCLSGIPLPRAAGVYLVPAQGVAIHSGYAGFTAGFDRSAVAACLARAVQGDRAGVVILDAERRSASLTHMPEAVGILAELNRHLVDH